MKKIIVPVGLSILLLIAMAAPAMGQWTVGISVGDWFKYEGTLVSWVSSGGVAFPPLYLEFLQVYNETDWFIYTVLDITPGDSGDNVTFSVLTHWSDGTETTADIEDNMTSSMTMMVIGAGLTEGEVIRTAYTDDFGIAWGARILGAPIMLTSPNGTRETNVCDYSVDIFGNIFEYLWYWDAETGVQVYYENSITNAYDYSSGGTYSYVAKLDLVDSSTEGVVVPDLAGPILLLSLMTITVPIVFLYKRKKPFN